MADITVTVKNMSGDFRKTTEVPTDMRLGDFRQAAQELDGLSNVTCTLLLEKNNRAVNENESFESAGIQPNTTFILASEDEGG
jgi:hypothetical protein